MCIDSPCRCKNRVGLDVPVSVRHFQRLDAERGAGAVADLPADDHLRREVDHDREVGPAGPGADVGDVAAQPGAGLLTCEIAADQVRGGLGVGVLARRDAVGGRLSTGEVAFAHHAPHQLPRADDTVGEQVAVDTPVPIRSVRGRVSDRGQPSDLGTPGRRGRQRPLTPGVVAARRDLEQHAAPTDREPRARLLRSDERIPLAHRRSFAKKAAAFPRNSTSTAAPTPRLSSASRARSLTVNGDSDTGCSSRYLATQFPSVPSVDLQLTRDLRDRPTRLDHKPNRFILELRRVPRTLC